MQNKIEKSGQTEEKPTKEMSKMIEQDTIKLLRECDAGIKMGISSIDDVLEHVESARFHTLLQNCRDEHLKLQTQIQGLLGQYKDEGKDPNPIAKGMSWMKTTMKLGLDESDATVASLMTEGCNMGVESLNRYLNQYKAASERSKDITTRLINLEKQLTDDIQGFL